MKVTITCELARLIIDLDELDAFGLLNSAVQLAMPRMPKQEWTSRDEEEHKPIDEVDEIPCGGDSEEEIVVPKRTLSKNEKTGKYKGFLHLRCDSCGQTKSMCVKVPIAEYACKCGAKTPLNRLVDFKVSCRCCGKYFQYKTNLMEQTTTVNCLGCGAPVELEFHERNQEYVSM